MTTKEQSLEDRRELKFRKQLEIWTLTDQKVLDDWDRRDRYILFPIFITIPIILFILMIIGCVA